MLIVDLFFLVIVSGMPSFAYVQTHGGLRSTTEHAIDFVFAFARGIDRASTLMQDLRLDLQEVSLNGGGTPDAPQEGRKPKHELAFDSCSGVIIGNDGCFERLVVLNIFQSDDDSFGSQAVSNCIVPRPSFAICGVRTGAAQRIVSIGFYLSKRRHPLARPSVFSETMLVALAAGVRLTA
jgi:hypothetical protein